MKAPVEDNGKRIIRTPYALPSVSPLMTTSAFSLTIVVSAILPFTKKIRLSGLSVLWETDCWVISDGIVSNFYEILVLMYLRFDIVPALAETKLAFGASVTSVTSQNICVN